MEISAILAMAFLCLAWIAEKVCPRDEARRVPFLTLTVCGVLTICLLAQLRFPWLLPLLERNAAKVAAGEWWRIVTALFFQDGWIPGGVTNIIALFFIGSLVEEVRSRWEWLLISMVGALIAACVALRWQPIGAGNSIATCSLAGSLVTLRPLSAMPRRSKVLRVIATAICIVLLAVGDVHGVAGMAGILLGSVVSKRRLWFASRA
jgi:rhomboid protease GluP